MSLKRRFLLFWMPSTVNKEAFLSLILVCLSIQPKEGVL
jgi:hypothetical protein